MRRKMSKEDRAKIFLSFDALKGYKEYLKKEEKVIVERKELLQDVLDELCWKIYMVKVGKMISMVYYDGENYVSLEGMVSKVDLENKKVIGIVNTMVPIADIVEIHGEGIEEY